MSESLNRHFPQLHLPPQGFDLTALGGAKLSGIASGVLASIGAIALNTATGFFMAFSAIILSFFFLLNDSQIARGLRRDVSARKRETARKLAAEVTQVFGSYISGQIIVSAITGIVIAIASAAIGFKFSLIIGIISGVAYAMPIIGMLIAEIIAVPLCLPQGLWMVVWVQVDHVRNGAHQR